MWSLTQSEEAQVGNEITSKIRVPQVWYLHLSQDLPGSAYLKIYHESVVQVARLWFQSIIQAVSAVSILCPQP